MQKDSYLLELSRYIVLNRIAVKSISEYADESTSRNMAIYEAYSSGGYSMKEVGDYFGLHYSRVSRILKGMKAKGKI